MLTTLQGYISLRTSFQMITDTKIKNQKRMENQYGTKKIYQK